MNWFQHCSQALINFSSPPLAIYVPEDSTSPSSVFCISLHSGTLLVSSKLTICTANSPGISTRNLIFESLSLLYLTNDRMQRDVIDFFLALRMLIQPLTHFWKISQCSWQTLFKKKQTYRETNQNSLKLSTSGSRRHMLKVKMDAVWLPEASPISNINVFADVGATQKYTV